MVELPGLEGDEVLSVVVVDVRVGDAEVAEDELDWEGTDAVSCVVVGVEASVVAGG